MHGPLALLSGLTPYMANNIVNNIELFGDTDQEFKDIRGKYWFYMSVALWNPLNILVVRMQCVEFPIKKLRHAVVDRVKNESYRMF